MITKEQEKIAVDLFEMALPYYWKTGDEYPARLKLQLFLNGYGSANSACVDIANHWIESPKLKREINRQLTHMESFKEIKR